MVLSLNYLNAKEKWIKDVYICLFFSKMDYLHLVANGFVLRQRVSPVVDSSSLGNFSDISIASDFWHPLQMS